MMHPGHAPTHVRTGFGAEREIELAAAVDPRRPGGLPGRRRRRCRGVLPE